MEIDDEDLRLLNDGISLARDYKVLDASRLVGVTVESTELPRDRVGSFDRTGRIRIDPPRAARNPGGVLGVLTHEVAHGLTPELDSPLTWHGPKFEAARRTLALCVRLARLRARRSGETPVITRRKEPITMPKHVTGPELLPVLRTAAAREYRAPGSLSMEQALAMIRRWEREHPTMASVPGITYTFRGGRVVPSFDDPRPASLAAKERHLRQQRARW